MSTDPQARRSRSSRHTNPADENLRAVARLEERARSKRSAVACVSDFITSCAGNEWSVAAHAVWFGAWLLFNSGLLPLPWEPFDPFPFSLLTSIVSLEARSGNRRPHVCSRSGSKRPSVSKVTA